MLLIIVIMRQYIAQTTTTQPQSTPNSTHNNTEVPIVGNGGAIALASILSVILTRLAAFVDWKEIGKQWSGSQTSKVLQTENRKTQEIEAEIDINQGLSDTVSQIAIQGVGNTSEITKDLLNLVGNALTASSANAQSTQALSRASESQVQATEDLIKATAHNSEALKALKEAIEAVPKETASVIEIYATEFRSALDLINRRLESIHEENKSNKEEILKELRLAETRIKEQYGDSLFELRKEVFQGRSDILESLK